MTILRSGVGAVLERPQVDRIVVRCATSDRPIVATPIGDIATRHGYGHVKQPPINDDVSPLPPSPPPPPPRIVVVGIGTRGRAIVDVVILVTVFRRVILLTDERRQCDHVPGRRGRAPSAVAAVVLGRGVESEGGVRYHHPGHEDAIDITATVASFVVVFVIGDGRSGGGMGRERPTVRQPKQGAVVEYLVERHAPASMRR